MACKRREHPKLATAVWPGILAGVFAGKPVIGIAGGIGSGKSFVARLFGEEGCLVIDSDQQVRDAYRRADVKRQLRRWWGDEVFSAGGKVDRAAVGRRVFGHPRLRRKLERLIHPLVGRMRQRIMTRAAKDGHVLAFIWDAPLLFEAGLESQCDYVVFVDAPRQLRVQRVHRSRGWTAGELAKREKSQWPLAKKKTMADYVIRNTAEAGFARDQVRQVLSHFGVKKDPTA